MSFIVVGIDGSASSQAALIAAVDQAANINAEVRAINVISLPVMSGYEFAPIDLGEMRAAGERTVSAAIDELDHHYNHDVPAKITTDVISGHVGIELLRAASEGDGASMVVAGSRGYGGLKSMLLGSVTTYLAHHLQCPLLIIPALEES